VRLGSDHLVCSHRIRRITEIQATDETRFSEFHRLHGGIAEHVTSAVAGICLEWSRNNHKVAPDSTDECVQTEAHRICDRLPWPGLPFAITDVKAMCERGKANEPSPATVQFLERLRSVCGVVKDPQSGATVVSTLSEVLKVLQRRWHPDRLQNALCRSTDQVIAAQSATPAIRQWAALLARETQKVVQRRANETAQTINRAKEVIM
jgi:hypothetical protein